MLRRVWTDGIGQTGLDRRDWTDGIGQTGLARSGKRPRLRARRVTVRFSLRAIILSLENLNVIIRAIN